MKTKFLIEKNYNISVVAEGLDINTANLEFCLLLDEYKLSIPLKNIKENVFRLKLPSKIKSSINDIKNIEYSIIAIKDNLVFEVAKSKFELELLAIKEVKIEETVEEFEEPISINPIIENDIIIEEEIEEEIEKEELEESISNSIIESENPPDVLDNIDINKINSQFKTLAYLIGKK